jgi:hypothetical protein
VLGLALLLASAAANMPMAAPIRLGATVHRKIAQSWVTEVDPRLGERRRNQRPQGVVRGDFTVVVPPAALTPATITVIAAIRLPVVN